MRMPDSLELELKVVSHLTEMLGLELKTSVRAKDILERVWGSNSDHRACVSYITGLAFPQTFFYSFPITHTLQNSYTQKKDFLVLSFLALFLIVA